MAIASKALIRKAGVNDYPLCLPLLSSLYHGDIGVDFRSAFESYIVGPDTAVLLALSQDELIGILIGSFRIDIDWEGRTAKIDAIIVDKKRRRMGIGKRLIRSFMAIAGGQKCKSVKSRVNIGNEEAQRFLESLGFARAHTYEYMLDLP